MSENLDFDSLEPIELEVKVKGKTYTLREASEGAAVEYRNAILACTKFGPGGKPSSVTNLGNVEPLLVSLCLFDDKNKRVPLAIVNSWPSRIVKKIFAEVKRISDISEEAPERKLLEKALNTEESPVGYESLASFINGLDKKEYDSLQSWMAPTEDKENNLKNEPAATTDSSD